MAAGGQDITADVLLGVWARPFLPGCSDPSGLGPAGQRLALNSPVRTQFKEPSLRSLSPPHSLCARKGSAKETGKHCPIEGKMPPH